MDVATQLDTIHKRIGTAVNPFTFMLTKRRYSPSLLLECADELESVVQDIRKFVKERKS